MQKYARNSVIIKYCNESQIESIKRTLEYYGLRLEEINLMKYFKSVVRLDQTLRTRKRFKIR